MWIPEVLYVDGTFKKAVAVSVDDAGRIERLGAVDDLNRATRLKNRALLPGMVNAHSHAFQRVIRARTEYRTSTNDSFWTWREMMYLAANRLDAEDIYDASRMAFLEMALSGITSVGEFHYLHHAPDGTSYEDPNLLSKEVVRAARDVGLRITLLRVAYARAGFNALENPKQKRFIELDPDSFLVNYDQLADYFATDEMVTTGIAPHSVRALPLQYLREIVGHARSRKAPVHMHVAEQQAEVAACMTEHGRSPVELLATEGLLSNRFTAVHAIHVEENCARLLASAGSMVCACPTTERNLGDGIIPADMYLKLGVPMCLGTDSQVQIELLEDARELEYHIRLQRQQRVVLAPAEEAERSVLATRLFDAVTRHGADSLGFSSGVVHEGEAADFFTVDLDDPSIAGAQDEDLLAVIVFSSSRSAVRDVFVGGKQIVTDGRHRDQDEIIQRFRRLQRKLWA